ncbi:hypothetical protein P167DRAFT_129135 [Morchella conica CCBAS932]|uniref:Uncharacterized protein n=1 Tax=Morchella conica CCBAS932 TaxID=1392247 RepID=A0A3N4L9U7_9PEZI|nr:hypothetical protein P167DRAFT_129135 [Morchella conica CCBAS932]
MMIINRHDIVWKVYKNNLSVIWKRERLWEHIFIKLLLGCILAVGFGFIINVPFGRRSASGVFYFLFFIPFFFIISPFLSTGFQSVSVYMDGLSKLFLFSVWPVFPSLFSLLFHVSLLLMITTCHDDFLYHLFTTITIWPLFGFHYILLENIRGC